VEWRQQCAAESPGGVAIKRSIKGPHRLDHLGVMVEGTVGVRYWANNKRPTAVTVEPAMMTGRFEELGDFCQRRIFWPLLLRA
jgi:hypothetical protein